MLCVTAQSEKKNPTHFFPSSSLTELTAQCSVSIGVISLGCETNVSNVPDPDQESDSGTGVAGGYTGPLLVDRQGTVNLEDQEPELHVFTSLLLQVMSPRCKKIQFSAAPFLLLLFERINTGLSAWREMEAEDSVPGGLGGKRAPVVHGASKQLKWAVGICNCPGAGSSGPASAGQTLLTGEEGSPAYKYSAILPLQQQQKTPTVDDPSGPFTMCLHVCFLSRNERYRDPILYFGVSSSHSNSFGIP